MLKFGLFNWLPKIGGVGEWSFLHALHKIDIFIVQKSIQKTALAKLSLFSINKYKKII